ncbi:MAG: hypothetical protein JW913_09150 [Chitinispirillaceae bacterium]|nr:hypothetical protein [Chitinispirillaceae bacterium]
MSIGRFFFISAVVALSLLLLLGGCSPNRIRLPVEEIKRPLSLPKYGGRVGYEMDAFVNSDNYSKGDRSSQGILMVPYIELGDKWEYYIPIAFRYYLVKNTEIRNHTPCITGANAAVNGGLTGVYYRNPWGPMLHFEAGLDYKRPLNDRLWLTSGAQLIYETNKNLYGGWARTGIGYQISRHFYATFAPSYTIHNPYVNEGHLISFPEIGRYFTLPLLLGVNITKTVSLYGRSSLVYFRDYTVRYGLGLGFHYTW